MATTPLAGGVLLSLAVPAQAQLIFYGILLLIGAAVMLFFGVQTHKQTLEQISPSLAQVGAAGSALGAD